MNDAIDFNDILHRMMEHKRLGTTDSAADIYEMDVAQYTDPRLFAQEIEHIFRRTPLLVGFGSDLASPGSYKTMDIAGVPLLVVRGDDSVVRAFINVCPHRGATVVTDESGCKRRFSCPFHAWTFNTRGALIGVSEGASFGAFDKSGRGLTPLPCEERDGLVWVVLSPDGTLDLDTFLGPLGAELAGFDFASAKPAAVRVLDGANWKIAMDTYLENYHLAALHPTTFAKLAISNMALFDSYGLHQRMVSPRKTIREFDDVDAIANPFQVLSLNYMIFPNTILLVSPEAAMLSRVVPGKDENSSITVQEHFSFTSLDDEDRRAAFDARVETTVKAVATEDYWITDGVQKGLRSNAVKTFLFGRNEIGLQNFHRQLDRAAEAFPAA